MDAFLFCRLNFCLRNRPKNAPIERSVERKSFDGKQLAIMKTKIFLGMMLAAILALGGGCALFVVGAAAGAGVGGYAYANGELKSSETVTYDTACAATLAAMKDLGFAVVEEKKDALTDKITARSTADKKVYVTLAKQSATSTEIRIRVGTFGDEPLSRQVMDKIKSHF